MAILRPDATTTLNGVKINEYLLTKHNPNHIDMPSVSMAGKIIGVTVHNTDWITVASGTTPAEQYTRATVNNNMKDVRVHYYVDNVCAWQNLPCTYIIHIIVNSHVLHVVIDGCSRILFRRGRSACYGDPVCVVNSHTNDFPRHGNRGHINAVGIMFCE